MLEVERLDVKKWVDEMPAASKGFASFDPADPGKKEADGYPADPLATTPPASASPEAAAPATPAPMSSDATIPQTPTIAPEAPQPQSEAKPETASETKGGTTPGSGA